MQELVYISKARSKCSESLYILKDFVEEPSQDENMTNFAEEPSFHLHNYSNPSRKKSWSN